MSGVSGLFSNYMKIASKQGENFKNNAQACALIKGQ